ncbi:hypothetical protein N7462_006507 [Penicillium macrosclerotiorum]|uniref:uncharacterized protein n=1 Tax=Penicillium macrosclerotiorum TaxID=303699 RepID=UPI0025492D98|nr:uncharacterized protein N7462_006507 [Penicillium macrosclerotiorum]KAJ5683342.1 hypothetical protein N7462_006507 [Penicillium macrosclerotiorum]
MSTSQISIAAEDTTEYSEAYAVTHEWLIAQGAVGLHPVGSRLVSLEANLTTGEVVNARPEER